MTLNDIFRNRIAPHTPNAANKNTPVTPTRCNKNERNARAIIMNMKHSSIATMATRNPTPRAINKTISPAGMT